MPELINNKSSLLRQLMIGGNEIKGFGVKKLGLFGSFANETKINAHSDIDFLVEFEDGKKTYDNFIELFLSWKATW